MNSSLGLICNERTNCYLWGKANIQMSSYITNAFGTIRRIHWLFFNSEKKKKGEGPKVWPFSYGQKNDWSQNFPIVSHDKSRLNDNVLLCLALRLQFLRSFSFLTEVLRPYCLHDKSFWTRIFFFYLFILILSTEGREPRHNFYGRVVFS